MNPAHASTPAAPAPRHSPQGHLTIEIRHDTQLEPADALLVKTWCGARPAIGVFLSPAWLSGFFEEPSHGWEPWLALLREGDELRGMVPLGISYRLRQPRVTLLGGGCGSDRVDILAARGYEHRCADALLWWLNQWSGRRGFVLQLRDVPHDSALWSALARLREPRAVVPSEINAMPYLDLQEYRTEAALPQVQAFTSSIAKHRRWLEARGHLRIDTPKDAGEALAALDVLTRLLHERWQGRWQAGQASALDDPARQRFHRRVIPRLLSDGLLRMLRVSVDLRTVVVYYGLGIGDWWGYYLGGYDRAWAGRIQLGRLMMAFAIDQAQQSGGSEFDFLKGAEPVKYLWPVRERITMDADVFTSTRGPQLLRASAASRELGAALAGAVRTFRLRS